MADQTKGLGERVGNEAHDDPDSGNPAKTGGRARTSLDSAVAQDDRCDQIMTTTGGALVAGVDGTTPLNIAVNASGQVEVDIAAQQSADITVAQATAATLNAQVVGDVAHDGPDLGNPVSQGLNAAEFNADPPQVSLDNDRVRAIATPQGIQWVLGGHPNILTTEYMTTAAQTNDPIIDSIAAGSQIVITAIALTVSAAGSTTPQVRIGFGTASVPAEPSSGASVAGVVLSHGGVAAGSGVVKNNVVVGGDDEELRITNAVPTGGKITVVVDYYISSL